MRIVITGAAGYVGSYLAQKLIAGGHSVFLIDNYFIPSHITSVSGVPINKIDIRESIDLSEYDVLVHLAAISGIKRCNDNPELAYSVNYQGTINLSKTFKGRVVFASTSAVYGEAKQPIINESHSTQTISRYGETKYLAEKICLNAHSYAILRFSNIYGKGITWKRTVTDNFIDCAIKKEPITIHGDGKQRRDFVHINDAVCAYWLAIKSEVSGIYNIGGDEALSINEIATFVKKNAKRYLGYDVDINYFPAEVGRQWHDFRYSSEEAKTYLGYEPVFSVSDEIRDRIKLYQHQQKG